MKLLSNLDLTKNQILNVALQNLGTPPGSPVAGQVYYNTSDQLVYYYDGTAAAWKSMAGDITAVNAGNGLTGGGSTGAVSLAVQLDGATLSVSASGVKITAGGVSATELASDAVTTIKILDKNVTFAKIQDVATMTVIGRVVAGSGVTSAVGIVTDMANASTTTLATSTAIKSYVDTAIAALGNLEGAFDASGSTFPVGSTPTVGTKKGDYWYVTVAGNVNGQMTLNVGDVIIANKDGAGTTTAADWIAIETNRDRASTTILGMVYLATNAEAQTGTDATKAITPASLASVTSTETRAGLIEIATQAEVTTGTDDARAITPLKLTTHLTNLVGGYAANIGNGVLTTIPVTHNLNTIDVIAEVKEVSTGEVVWTDMVITNSNTVTFYFAVAPTSNQYRVIIKK